MRWVRHSHTMGISARRALTARRADTWPWLVPRRSRECAHAGSHLRMRPVAAALLAFLAGRAQKKPERLSRHRPLRTRARSPPSFRSLTSIDICRRTRYMSTARRRMCATGSAATAGSRRRPYFEETGPMASRCCAMRARSTIANISACAIQTWITRSGRDPGRVLRPERLCPSRGVACATPTQIATSRHAPTPKACSVAAAAAAAIPSMAIATMQVPMTPITVPVATTARSLRNGTHPRHGRRRYMLRRHHSRHSAVIPTRNIVCRAGVSREMNGGL